MAQQPTLFDAAAVNAAPSVAAAVNAAPSVAAAVNAAPSVAARSVAAGPKLFVVYFDGACRGNPGPASYGVYSPSGVTRRAAIGKTTNNVAEWRGFLAALDAAIDAGAADVEVRADSQLVLKQFLGEYRMKAAHLAGYLTEARKKAARIARLRVVHVPRAQNHEADRLANLALDELKK